jgi:hypothetical protein
LFLLEFFPGTYLVLPMGCSGIQNKIPLEISLPVAQECEMTLWLVAMALILLLAGWAFGAFRKYLSPSMARKLNWLFLAVLLFPFWALLFAKLAGSDALGWVFGLSLIFGIPVLGVFLVGFVIGSVWPRSNTSPRGNGVSQDS